MKNIPVLIFFLFSALCASAQEVDINGCHITVFHDWGGKTQTRDFNAYGNVYVETNPNEVIDMKVRIVSTEREATYNVYKTTDTPQKCGEWRFVTDRSKAKFVIRYVNDREDCRIWFTNDRSKAGF